MNRTLLDEKIRHPDYARMIADDAAAFSDAEAALLDEILTRFSFDPVQAQALVQAVRQQRCFDPDAAHIADSAWDEDEESTFVCPHCLNPPVPPLRDYYMWREGQSRQACLRR